MEWLAPYNVDDPVIGTPAQPQGPARPQRRQESRRPRWLQALAHVRKWFTATIPTGLS